jgi:hypothetical protein
MDLVHEDSYVVFVRADQRHDDWPERAERPLAVCASYGEARRAQRYWNAHFNDHCVIRFVGAAGGGD